MGIKRHESWVVRGPEDKPPDAKLVGPTKKLAMLNFLKKRDMMPLDYGRENDTPKTFKIRDLLENENE